MAVIDHAVGDHGRQQRFNGRQQGNGDGRLEKVLHIGPGQFRHAKSGQALRNPAEAGPDRLDGELEKRYQRRAEDHRDNGARDTARQRLRPEHDDQRGRERQGGGEPLPGSEIFAQRFHLFHKVRRHPFQFQSEEILDLRAEDQDCDAAGESHRDRVGDEFDHRAHPRESHDEQHDAGHDGADEQIIESVSGNDAVNDDHESARWPPDLNFRPAQSGDDEPRHNGRKNSGFGFDSRRDAERHGQRQG